MTPHRRMRSEFGKTLNFFYRKREGERIERENMAFAKRLLAKRSEFSKNRMDEEYERHVRYRNQILKVVPSLSRYRGPTSRSLIPRPFPQIRSGTTSATLISSVSKRRICATARKVSGSVPAEKKRETVQSGSTDRGKAETENIVATIQRAGDGDVAAAE